jgi:AraC-like DNA-binding protein
VKPHLDFRSRNLEQTIGFLSDNNICLEIARRHERALNVHVNGIYLPAGLYVGSTEYGAKASVQVSPRRLDYWLLIPIRGQMETTVRGRQFISDARQAFLFSYPAMGPSRIVVDAGALRMTVVMSHTSLDRQLAALLGKPCDTHLRPPLEFTPTVDLKSGHGRSIARLAHLVLEDFDRGEGLLAHNSVALGSLEQFVITELLLSQPHNYSAAIYGTVPSVAPRDVKRATDYMEANLRSPVTLNDIVRAAGIPGRTLFKHFENFRGVSPMAFLRAARFEKAREALLHGEPTRKIADVAMAWGFTNMGRFSVEYRKRFGECPSETLKRSR